MILTGKALKDFEKYAKEVYDDCGFGQTGKRLFYIESIDSYKFVNTDHYIENVGQSMLNALIIDWFDSVGINILITCEFDYGYEILEKRYDILEEIKKWYDSREEATQQAIIKANEIYNNLKSEV